MKRFFFTLVITGIIFSISFELQAQVYFSNCTPTQNKQASAIGLSSSSTGNQSFASGNYALASGDYATALGSYVQATGNNAFAFGSGISTSSRLSNTTANSFLLGFNNSPVLFAQRHSSGVPRVGIGIKTPEYTLDVNGDANADNVYTNNIYFTGSGMKIIKQGKGDLPGVGPGTYTKDIMTLTEYGSVAISGDLTVNGGLYVQLAGKMKSLGLTGTSSRYLEIGELANFYYDGTNYVIGQNCRYSGRNDVRIQNGMASRVYFGNAGNIVLQTAENGTAGSNITTWNTVSMNNNGYVGIGTNNPSERLQIGDIWTFHNGGTKYIGRNVTYKSGNNVRIENGGTSLISFGNGTISLETAKDSVAGSQVNTTGKNITLTAEGNVGIGITIPAKKLHVQGDTYLNGNVGIGINNPQSRLHVLGDVSIQDDTFKLALGKATGQTLNWGTSYIGFNATREYKNGNWIWTLNGDGANNGGGVMWTTVHGNIYFATIPSTGKIDKTLTDAQIRNNVKLHLTPDGVLRAKEVLVTLTGWPDYVFEEDYALMSLQETEQFIKENKRLPAIPSAAEVAENGVNLGEMNALLLKKVEELTLYILQQNSDIQLLKEEVQALKEGR